MQSDNVSDIVSDMRLQVIDDLLDEYVPPKKYADQWDIPGLEAAVREKLHMNVPLQDWATEEGVDQEVLRERLTNATDAQFSQKEQAFGIETMRNIEKQILLQAIDAKWREHLLQLEHLRSVVGFRAYAQRDPLSEFKNEGFTLFEIMLDTLRAEVTQKISQIRPMSKEEQAKFEADYLSKQRAGQSALGALPPSSAEGAQSDMRPEWAKTARNELCPCGSGSKFKYCHGKL